MSKDVNAAFRMGDFAEFADALNDQREHTEAIVRLALKRVGERSPTDVLDELRTVAHTLDDTLSTLERAAEELRVQNDALFAARGELEDMSAVFRDLFDLAPTASLVTAPDTRILYLNQAACALLRRARNGLAGKPLICHVPLEYRAGFRSAVIRSNSATGISEWAATLFPFRASTTIACRVRIRPVTGLGTQRHRALYWNITEETDEDLF